MPADILRDRDDAPPTFSDLASAAGRPPDLPAQIQARRESLAQLEQNRAESGEAEVKAQEERAAAMKPAIAQAEQAVSAPTPPPPAPLALPPPPSRQLTDFLAPVQGEQPENTISKLMQGIGLLASGFTGLRRGNATTAIASMQGALRGWHDGDRERADRHFADWKAATDTMIEAHESQHRAWTDILKDKALNVEQKLKLLELSGIKEGYEPAIAAARTGNLDAALKFQQHDLDQLTKLQEHRDRLLAMDVEKRRHEQFLLELRRTTEAQKKADLAASLPDTETLRVMGQQWAVSGKMPSIGQGGKGAAIAIRSAVIKHGIDWAKENGIDPMSLQGMQAEVASNRAALTTLRRNNATQEEAMARLDKHLETLIKLSDMVPRSEIPAINGAIVRGEKQYKGSPEAAEYVAQAVEAAMEQARVQVPGGAQGDAASREEVRKTISPDLSPLQVKAVANRYRQNARQSLEANREKEKDLVRSIDNLGGRIQGPPIPPPPMGTPDDPLGIMAKPKVAEKQ